MQLLQFPFHEYSSKLNIFSFNTRTIRSFTLNFYEERNGVSVPVFMFIQRKLINKEKIHDFQVFKNIKSLYKQKSLVNMMLNK